MNSYAMFSSGPLHRDEQVLYDLLELIYSSCVDTGCSLDLPEAMDDRDEWQERVKEIRASGTT